MNKKLIKNIEFSLKFDSFANYFIGSNEKEFENLKNEITKKFPNIKTKIIRYEEGLNYAFQINEEIKKLLDLKDEKFLIFNHGYSNYMKEPIIHGAHFFEQQLLNDNLEMKDKKITCLTHINKNKKNYQNLINGAYISEFRKGVFEI